MAFCFAYVTVSGTEEAQRIARDVVESKLAACANFFPISSIFEWEGKISEESEVVMLLKTQKSLFEKLKARVADLHSYDVPCIVEIPVGAIHSPFGDWVKKQTH